MQVTRVSTDLSDPAAEGWSAVPSETVQLARIPLEAQPTEYVRAAWSDRPYGATAEVDVAAAHDGSVAWIRLEWNDSSAENGEFPDAAAAYFPAGQNAPAATIGDEAAPVNLWFWRADEQSGRDLVATGPGRFRPRGDSVKAQATLQGGRWAVVLSRASSDLESSGRLGVAVWDGSNEERAGIGAATPEWVPVEIG